MVVGVVTSVNFAIHVICALARESCIPYHPQVKPELNPASSVFEGGNEPPPIVNTSSGTVEGYYMRTIRNRQIVAFEGIPYAKPPVGKLRFRAPEPIEPWPGVRKTKSPGTICLQLEPTQYFRVYGHESCLFLNIYTPNLPLRRLMERYGSLLPIIFFIHGGAHTSGAGEFYGPSYLLDKQNVILVTLNFRVGILGFFTTGDGAAPGNYGLKDQALALQWIQANAQKFGGDPKRITISGQSSGAAAAGLHLMSPKSKHIPWAGILHSGHPLHHWAIVNKTLDSSRKVARSFGCVSADSYAIMKCMRSQNPYFVVEHHWRAYEKHIFPLVPFGPTIEVPSKNAFLTEAPEVAFENGNFSTVPILLGLVRNEGDFIAAIGYLQRLYSVFRKEWLEIGPLVFDIDVDEFTPSEVTEATHSLRQFYFPNNETFSYQNRDMISQGIGDRFLGNGIRKGFEWHSKIAPTFGFIFNYVGKHSSLESLGYMRDVWGVSHADDLQFLFNSSFLFKPLKTTDCDFQMVDFVTNVWGNFASKRKPVFTNADGVDMKIWSPVSAKGDIKILEINNEVKMISYPFEKRYQFWKHLGGGRGLKDDFRNPHFERPTI